MCGCAWAVTVMVVAPFGVCDASGRDDGSEPPDTKRVVGRPGRSHAEEVAHLAEEAIGRAVQPAEAELARLVEGGAVAEIDERPRRGAIAEEPVHAKLVADAR